MPVAELVFAVVLESTFLDRSWVAVGNKGRVLRLVAVGLAQYAQHSREQILKPRILLVQLVPQEQADNSDSDGRILTKQTQRPVFRDDCTLWRDNAYVTRYFPTSALIIKSRRSLKHP